MHWSAKASITRPRVCKDLLMRLASLRRSLLSPTPVLETLSEPARSTKLIRLVFLVIFLKLLKQELPFRNPLLLNELEHHDGVGSWAVLVHQSRCQWSVLGSFVHFFLDFGIGKDGIFIQTLDIDSQSLVLSDFKSIDWSLVGIDEQVLDLFVINLKHGDSHLILTLALFLEPLDSLEELFASHRYNAFVGAIPDHGVWLSGPGLAIGKQAAIESYPELERNYQAFSRIYYPNSA